MFVFPIQAQNSRPLPAEQAFQLSINRQNDNSLNFEWKIANGYYLYQKQINVLQKDKPLSSLEILGEVVEKEDPTFGLTNVYYDKANARITEPVDLLSDIELHYQGCQENGICYPATVKTINPLTLVVKNSSGTFNAQLNNNSASNAQLQSNWSYVGGNANTVEKAIDNTSVQTSSTGITIADNNGGMVENLQKQGGIVLVLGSFLIFGLLLAFTPCVFPMYPILAGAIAREGKDITTKRSFLLSFVYVVSMATAFGLLGVAAAWSGQNLQMALQSPIAIILVSLLFIILSLSMFGLFEIQLPRAFVNFFNKMGNGKRGSYTSASVLGFTSALIVGPCVTAPLAGALLYIAQTGDVLLGALALFALGLGKGIPLIIFGTVGQKALPKAGSWMNAVRQLFGFFFIAAAIYMISRIIHPEYTIILWAIFAIIVAVWLIFLNAFTKKKHISSFVSKALGGVFALYSLTLIVGLIFGGHDPLNPFGSIFAQRNKVEMGNDFQKISTLDALKETLKNNTEQQTLLYVTADWCISCTVIEKTVLNDDKIMESLQPFHLIKFDVSKNTEEQQQVMQELQVYGPPTMIFLNALGGELSDTRLIGDITKTTLQGTIQKVEDEV